MHLWDKASGNLTDFTTNFSFVIDSQNNTNYGDGLAFFLAPNVVQRFLKPVEVALWVSPAVARN
jgi:hypothetical protein